MLIIGIDIGTTGTKAMVVNEKGGILGVGYKSYPLILKGEDRVEQDAALWYSAACHAVKGAAKNIDPAKVCALCLSAQGASSLLVDSKFVPLTNAITWMDVRAAEEKEEIIKALGDEYIYRKTGWRAFPSLDASKLLWIKKNKKNTYDKSALFVSTLEYMNFKMTGVAATDPTSCAMRQLMDIETLDYDEGILNVIGLDKRKLPVIMPTGEYLGNLTPKAADDFGLTPKVKVYNGAHDQYCSLYGANIINDNELMLSTGTAWAALGVSSRPVHTSSFLSTGPHVVKGKYGALSSIPAAGAAYDWLKDKIIDENYDGISEKMNDERMKKCANLLFFPYLSGASFPIWDKDVKGAFLGLTLDCDKYDLALACMEGVVFALKMTLEEYPGVKTIKVMGGATQNKTWMDILSALCNSDLLIMDQKDIACIGAALIAATGEGLDYNYLANKLRKSKKSLPAKKEIQQHYMEKYEKYKASLNKMLEI